MDAVTPCDPWRQRTRWVAAAIFLMTASFILTKTGRDALYFQGRGLYGLPTAYIAMAMLALPMAAAALSLMRVVGARRARVLATSAVALVIGAFEGLARPGSGPVMTAFFTLVLLAFGILFSMGWLLGADLLDQAPRAKLAHAYSVIGAASIAGGVAAALLAKLLARHLEPQRFLLLGAVALAGSASVMAATQGRFPTRMSAARADAAAPGCSDLRPLLRTRYVGLLLLTGMTAALGGLLIEFQFYVAAATSRNAVRANTNLFANFYLLLNLLALSAQLWLMPRFQRALGVYGSLFVLPGALLGGSLALLADASLLTRSLLRVTEGGLKASIHRSNWEQAYVPLTRAQRSLAKLLVDGAGARITEGLAAVMLYAWLRWIVAGRALVGQSTAWVTWSLLASALLWIALTRALRRSLVPATVAHGADAELHLDIPLPDT